MAYINGNKILNINLQKVEVMSDVIDFARFSSHIEIEDLNLLGKENVVLNLDNVSNLNNFNFTDHLQPKPPENTAVKHLTINCPNKITSLSNAFSRIYMNDNFLERLTLNLDTSAVTNLYYFIAYLKALKVIDGQPLDFSSVNNTQACFSGIDSLEEIRFVENSIPKSIIINSATKLSKESITSFVNGLNSDVTEQTLTLSKTAVNTAFETAEGLTDGNTSEEWLNLIATKPNWTITLS